MGEEVRLVVAASVEDVASLEAHLAGPTRADTPEPAKGGIAEKLQFALGVPLLAAVTVWCFSQGRVLMGIFLLLCLAFATILLVFMLKDDGSPRDAAVSSGEKAASSLDSLRASGELDVAARDFPHEAQCPGDHIRFGNGYVFDRDQHAACSYAQVQRLQVKGLTQGGQAAALTLEAQLREGGTKLLYVVAATDAERARIADICQRIQRGNPFVQMG